MENRMASEDPLKEVNLRLERLEAKLDTVARTPSVSNLTADDIAAFHKVRNAFWEDGSCGINETSPCIGCNAFVNDRVVKIPIPTPLAECICGPCMCGVGGSFGGIQRFGGLGG